MTVTELAETIAANHELSKAGAQRIIDDVLEQLGAEIAKGNYIRLGKLGSFTVTKRNARKARNPRTGEAIKVPAKKVVKFKVAKAIDDKLNKPKAKASKATKAAKTTKAKKK